MVENIGMEKCQRVTGEFFSFDVIARTDRIHDLGNWIFGVVFFEFREQSWEEKRKFCSWTDYQSPYCKRRRTSEQRNDRFLNKKENIGFE